MRGLAGLGDPEPPASSTFSLKYLGSLLNLFCQTPGELLKEGHRVPGREPRPRAHSRTRLNATPGLRLTTCVASPSPVVNRTCFAGLNAKIKLLMPLTR